MGQQVGVDEDRALMQEAIAAAATVRSQTSPNPWVGCVIVPAGDEPAAIGVTQPPGGQHAEAMALELAGPSAAGAVVYVTLEPCSHHGRTPPCADALVAAGVRRVVVGLVDPDPHVAGAGIERLRRAGVEVTVGVAADEVAEQLAPYLKHRTSGRPWVVLKLAAGLDGRTAAPDGTSQWITGPEARADAHRLRAESDAILVGAGTVRADNPSLTVRDADGRDPLRVVLGTIPEGARIMPALQLGGDLGEVLDELGSRGVLQLLVEGGATVAHEFHRSGLVDRYVFYLAPVLFGGDDSRPMFAGAGAGTMNDVWRGRIVSAQVLGPDVRIELAGTSASAPPARAFAGADTRSAERSVATSPPRAGGATPRSTTRSTPRSTTRSAASQSGAPASESGAPASEPGAPASEPGERGAVGRGSGAGAVTGARA